VTGLIGCALPRQRPFEARRRHVQRVLFSFPLPSNLTLQNSTSFTTFLSTSSVFSKSVGAVSLILEEEGLLLQPR
jgi:hypothetical protein